MFGPDDEESSSSSETDSDSSGKDEELEIFPEMSDTNTTATTSFTTIGATNDCIIDEPLDDETGLRGYGMKQMQTTGGGTEDEAMSCRAPVNIIPSISATLTEALNEMEAVGDNNIPEEEDNAGDTVGEDNKSENNEDLEGSKLSDGGIKDFSLPLNATTEYQISLLVDKVM